MRDINPDPYGPTERSIRNIPVSHRRAHPQQSEHAEPNTPPARPRRRRRVPRLAVLTVAFIALCALAAILVSTVFAGVTVHVTPRTVTVNPTGSISAQLNGPVGTLPYHIATATRSATTTVPTSGTQQVSLPASGVITIYNAYSSASQLLIARTRFEAPDGKIYRIKAPVTVPGMQGSTPGSVSATVYADNPGDAYDRSDNTTFTIPGFQGTPRYTKFSAQSQGPISGGFVGTEPAVSSTDLANAKQQLEQSLQTAVDQTAQSSIPEGYVALPGTLAITFGDTAQTQGGGNTAIVSESANATEYLVSKADLANAVAKETVSNYGGEAVALDPNSTLSLSVATTSQQDVLTVTFGGQATLIWQFDPNAIKQALLGKPKSQFQDVLKSFAPAINCTTSTPCDASIRPFWQSTFPNDPSKIHIVVVPAA